MTGLLILLALLVASLLSSAFAATVGARLVGSSRAKFRIGLLATVLIGAINIIFAVAANGMMKPGDVGSAIAAALFLLGLQCIVAFVVLKAMFRLSPVRALCPLGGLIVAAIIQVAFALLVLRPYVIETFAIQAGGMSPTLASGDRFLVNKLGSPRRWDLVAYRVNARGGRAVYCQRLIGMPGERLRFEGGNVFIDDQPATPPAVVAGRYRTAIPHARTLYVDGQTIRLASDEYFLIGDNVDVSADSRILGPAIRSDLVGPVDLIYWPLGKIRILR